MPRTVILRTHYSDPDLEGFIATLSQAGTVTAVVDESGGPVDLQGTPKIPLTEHVARNLGLYTGVPRVFWRCGDYSLYAARQQMPEVDYFWMVEPDVRLSFDDIAQFFDIFDSGSTADFLAVGVRPAEPAWDWATTMRGRYPTVWQCLFPLIRLSGGAIDFLLQQRQADSTLMAGKDPAAWPNDESFVTTLLANNGYSVADFNDFGTFYNDATFSFWKPIQKSALHLRPPDQLIYHPVLSGERYFEKLFYIAYCQRDFRPLEKLVVELIGHEWPESAARNYLQVMREAQKLFEN